MCCRSATRMVSRDGGRYLLDIIFCMRLQGVKLLVDAIDQQFDPLFLRSKFCFSVGTMDIAILLSILLRGTPQRKTRLWTLVTARCMTMSSTNSKGSRNLFFTSCTLTSLFAHHSTNAPSLHALKEGLYSKLLELFLINGGWQLWGSWGPSDGYRPAFHLARWPMKSRSTTSSWVSLYWTSDLYFAWS